MSSSSPRKRLTVIASAQGVKKAETTLSRLGFDSKTSFAEAQLLSRTAVTKFFNQQPIQPDTFKRICEGLKLDWREILDSESDGEIRQLEETGQPEVLESVEMSANATSQTRGTTLAIARKITVLDAHGEVKAKIVLKGDIEFVNDSFKTTLEVVLQRYGGDTIQITDIKPGSIKITIQGSQQDINQLRQRITSGELTQINQCRVEDFRILGDESLEASKNASLETKWEIIQAIKTQPQLYRQVREADLSDADLSGADLSGADLSRADLSGADLSGADLSGADLSGADLSRADLSGASLWRADLREAVLREAVLREAVLREADLSGADLSGANLWEAILWGVDLREADLRGANLWRADLWRAIINASTQLDQKWRFVHEIVNLRASGRDLSGTDLRGAFLRGAFLREADLREADLRGADLWGADLRGADLRGADLWEAVVLNADFGEGTGLSQKEKQDLARQGAIFGDASGDRESAYSPVR